LEVPLSGSDVTLSGTQLNYTEFKLTGTLTTNVSVIVPTDEHTYTIINEVTGDFSVTVRTSAGTGVVVPQGQTFVVRCDGVDVVRGVDSQRTIYVGSVAELEALSLAEGVNVYLTQEARAGEFVVKTGTPPSDPQKGIYIVLANWNYAERIEKTNLTPEIFGAVGDGLADDTAALNEGSKLSDLSGISSSEYLITDTISLANSFYGNGCVWKFSGASTPNKLAVNIENKSNVKFKNTFLNIGQSVSTTSADNKFRYGIYINNSVDVLISDVEINSIKVGFPFYITGSSSNGIDPSTTGSKRVNFVRVRVDGIETDDADSGDLNQLIVRSDFYDLDGGGTYYGASNGLKKSDLTIDALVTYPATTEKIRITDCEFKNCDRLGFLNVKDSVVEGVNLERFGYRGVNCAPTCENITVRDVDIDGGFGASINFSYASNNCKADDIKINPFKYNPNFVGFSEGTAVRVLYGCSNNYITNVKGVGGHIRSLWILGSSDIYFDNISLTKNTQQATEKGIVISGAEGGNSANYTLDNIYFTDCILDSNIGYEINEFTGTADYADGAITLKNCIFKVSQFTLSTEFLNAPPVQNKTIIRDTVFRGTGETNNLDRRFILGDTNNIYNLQGTATYADVFSDIHPDVLPDSLPTGLYRTVINGQAGVPAGAVSQGTLISFKPIENTGFRKFIYQEYTEVSSSDTSHPSVIWRRHGGAVNNVWTPWYSIT